MSCRDEAEELCHQLALGNFFFFLVEVLTNAMVGASCPVSGVALGQQREATQALCPYSGAEKVLPASPVVSVSWMMKFPLTSWVS